MTNNPPIAAWAPSAALHKLASRRNNAPCILTDAPAEFNDVALIRLSDYEALQAAYEEELSQLRQTRDAHFGEMMRALEQVDALKAECEELRNLLRHAQPIIRAHAEASHMLEGFRPRRNQWDELVEGIDAAIQEENRGR